MTQIKSDEIGHEDDVLQSDGAETPSSQIDEPPRGRLVVTRSPDRFGLVVPAAGLGAAINFRGIFAAAWLGIIMSVTLNAISSTPPLFLIILSVFWIVGLVMGWSSLRAAFGSVAIEIGAQQFVFERRIFNKTYRRIKGVLGDIRAIKVDQKIERHRSDDRSPWRETIIHRVMMTVEYDEHCFGEHLSDQEREWIVEQLNQARERKNSK